MTESFAPGDVVGGKFRVERVVGRGGMGVVIEATNVQLEQRVALKLLAAGSQDPAVVERFTREARAAARLRSEHIARVFDVGRDKIHGPFIVMELLDGRTLADVLETTGRVALHRSAEYVIGACEGLAEAHTRGIVHQDVKPGNLFLVGGADGRPTIKLLDFGIATVRTTNKTREADGRSSHPSMGTPAYLAPEQIRAAEIDHRTDIWALGCVLYELISGVRPFRAPRFTELVTKILESAPEPPPEEADVPAPILAIIHRCLEKDPAKRYASTGELALALLPFARRRAHSAVARAVAQVKAAGLDPTLQMPSSMPPPPEEEMPSSMPHIPIPPIPLPNIPSIPVEIKAEPEPAPMPARSNKAALAAIAILLLLGAIGVFAWARHAEDGPAAPEPAAPVRSAAALPATSAVPPAPPVAPAPAPSATVLPPTHTAAPPPPPPAVGPRRPPPTPSTTLKRPDPDERDIRPTR